MMAKKKKGDPKLTPIITPLFPPFGANLLAKQRLVFGQRPGQKIANSDIEKTHTDVFFKTFLAIKSKQSMRLGRRVVRKPIFFMHVVSFLDSKIQVLWDLVSFFLDCQRCAFLKLMPRWEIARTLPLSESMMNQKKSVPMGDHNATNIRQFFYIGSTWWCYLTVCPNHLVKGKQINITGLLILWLKLLV